jgi:hypothetical protein
MYFNASLLSLLLITTIRSNEMAPMAGPCGQGNGLLVPLK